MSVDWHCKKQGVGAYHSLSADALYQFESFSLVAVAARRRRHTRRRLRRRRRSRRDHRRRRRSRRDHHRRPDFPAAAALSLGTLASLTVNARPSTCLPLNAVMAAWASASDPISTKPKPLERPVSRSMMT